MKIYPTKSNRESTGKKVTAASGARGGYVLITLCASDLEIVASDRISGGGSAGSTEWCDMVVRCSAAMVLCGAVRARVFSAFLIADRCSERRVRQQPSTRTRSGNKRGGPGEFFLHHGGEAQKRGRAGEGRAATRL